MKYLLALSASIITVFILKLLNEYVLKLMIPDFLIGWFSCIAWYSIINKVDTKKNNS